jgi:mannose-6-phosphate isomerase-like protein (cupin superfamily)
MGGVCSSPEDDRPPKPGGIDTVCLAKEDIQKIDKEGYNDRDHGRCSWRTLISSDRTPSNSLTAGIATCGPRKESQPASSGGNLAPHRHYHAEIYFIMSGEGIVNVDMIEHKVKAGSVVFIPGNAEHSVRNLSLTEELVWYYCFAAESFQDVRYRFKNDLGRTFVP